MLLSNSLPEEYDFKELINKIKQLNESLEIIVFLEDKDEDIENFLNSKKLYKIYYLKNIDLDNVIRSLIPNYKKVGEQINREINDLKELILSNKNVENISTDESKTIAVTGAFGVGKSIFSCLLAKLISIKNKKTLLIDFDTFNKSISTIFESKQRNKSSKIYRVSKHLDILFSPEKLVDLEDNLDVYKIKEILNSYKNEYDFIIIDTSSCTSFKYVQILLANSDKILFLVEPNISELKKAKNLLEIYINDFDIDVDKIKIIFNKTNKYQIAESILEEIFTDFEVIGNIEYQEKYNIFINQQLNNYIQDEEYEKIYEKILRR